MSDGLAGYQRRALRAQAHALHPVVQIGQEGLGATVLRAVEEALAAHELIKVRFVDHKDDRRALSADLADRCGAHLAGLVGHVAILYRPHADPQRRRVHLPVREGG